MKLRWGIVSAGKICHDFATALTLLPKGDHEIVAVAAQDIGRAKKFAETHKIPKFYDSYEALAQDPDVVVVYIGAINPKHYSLAMLMLDHGKHVLCEKPLCINAKQGRKLFEHAKSKNLFIMEAIWSRFFPAYDYLRACIDAGKLGEVREVNIQFGFPLADVDRLSQKALGGGTILDLGIYTIQLSQWVFGEKPKTIKATGKLNEEGCDMEMKAILSYDNGKTVNMMTSALEKLNNEAVIKGTLGEIRFGDFWCPTELIDTDKTVRKFKLPTNQFKDYNFMNSNGLHYEAEEVRQCLMQGLLESKLVPQTDSVIIADISDEIRKQIGVHYPEDDEEF